MAGKNAHTHGLLRARPVAAATRAGPVGLQLLGPTPGDGGYLYVRRPTERRSPSR